MKENLNILLLGHGDREKAIASSLLRSPRCQSLFLQSPDVKDAAYADLDETDFEAVARFCDANAIDILIPGSERLIQAGIRNAIESNPLSCTVKVIAPGADGAMLEGSKEYAKEFMDEEGIPSPRFMPVDMDTLEEGINFIDSLPGPYVLKADGLADGEGVIISSDPFDAKDALKEMIGGKFGKASEKVLIEEFVNGTECTVMIATDGEDYIILPPARDYKRLLEGDRGPNTRGMGAYSPVEFADDAFMEKVRKRIISPTLRGLKSRGIDYHGFLYFGLMNIDGEPVMLEYNVRLGDPETQAVLPLIESDLTEILEGIADSTVGLKKIKVSPMASASVTLLDSKAGKRSTVTAMAETPEAAAALAYDRIRLMTANGELNDNIRFRTDIAASYKTDDGHNGSEPLNP